MDNFDPALAYDLISNMVIGQIYESLYEYHYLKRPYTLRPGLAESMPIIQNKGKRYIIKIKKNVSYHPNKCFDHNKRFLKSDDFLTQFKRIAFAPTKSTGLWLYENIVGLKDFHKKVGNDLKKLKNTKIKGIETPDPHTLIINLKKPSPGFLYTLAMAFSTPIPMELVDCHANNLTKVAIGTGPYKLTYSDESLHFIELEKFKNFRNDTYVKIGDRKANEQKLLKDAGKKVPFIDIIHFHVDNDSNIRWKKFLNKEIDFLILPKDFIQKALTPFGELSPSLKKINTNLQITTTLTLWWLAFNMKDPLLGKNKNLRFAFAHAIPIDEYIQKHTHNVAQKANSLYPPGIEGYNPSHKLNFTYDLKLAKKYLKEAGYPEGKNLPVIPFDTRGHDTKNKVFAHFIQQSLKKIGIRIKIVENSFPEFLKKLRSGNLTFWPGGWALDYPDAENLLQLLSSKNHPPGPNGTYYQNAEFDQLLSKLITSDNVVEKRKIMDKIQNLVSRDLPWIMLYYSRDYILYHNNIKNFRHSYLGNNYYKYLKKTPPQ